MLAVHKGDLVVEEKGIYSIEKFLIARRLMYWQVYLHKTVLVAEQMLVQVLQRAKDLTQQGIELPVSPQLAFFLKPDPEVSDFQKNRDLLLENFALLDDFDIVAAMKNWMQFKDPLLAYLSASLINRRLFKIEMQQFPFKSDYVENLRQRLIESTSFPSEQLNYLLFQGKETNNAYSTSKDEIKILFKNGKAKPMSISTDYGLQSKIVTKYYLCYPKNLI